VDGVLGNLPRGLHGLAIVAVLAFAGCGGSPDTAAAPSRLVGPEAFEAAIAEPARVTLNVHVPDEGSLAGTDLAIPFDELAARASELPAPGSPIALYCRSGNMSATAAKTLATLGYEDVVELDGGFRAWEASGRRIVPPGSS
jgi:rhodanese-related sulfurtransferase